PLPPLSSELSRRSQWYNRSSQTPMMLGRSVMKTGSRLSDGHRGNGQWTRSLTEGRRVHRDGRMSSTMPLDEFFFEYLNHFWLTSRSSVESRSTAKQPSPPTGCGQTVVADRDHPESALSAW